MFILLCSLVLGCCGGDNKVNEIKEKRLSQLLQMKGKLYYAKCFNNLEFNREYTIIKTGYYNDVKISKAEQERIFNSYIENSNAKLRRYNMKIRQRELNSKPKN